MKPSILKRAHHGLSLFAVLQLLLLGGLVGYMTATGVVDMPKLKRIGAILRGDEPQAPCQPVAASTSIAPKDRSTEGPSQEEMDIESPTDLEIMRLEAERIKVEVDQRLVLVQSIMLKVTSDREALQKERQIMAERQDGAAAARRRDGIRKQVEIFEGLSAKVAVEHLLGIEDPDEAARLLVAIDMRKAQEIIKAAKRGDPLKRMQTILQRVREVAPEQSATLERESPEKS